MQFEYKLFTLLSSVFVGIAAKSSFYSSYKLITLFINKKGDLYRSAQILNKILKSFLSVF